MNVTIPLENILKSLSYLSGGNKRWLAEHLIEEADKEEADMRVRDEAFVREFLAMPYDSPMTAEEEKELIRNSHHFDPDRKVAHLYDN